MYSDIEYFFECGHCVQKSNIELVFLLFIYVQSLEKKYVVAGDGLIIMF